MNIDLFEMQRKICKRDRQMDGQTNCTVISKYN
jgi:hypothetical protein